MASFTECSPSTVPETVATVASSTEAVLREIISATLTSIAAEVIAECMGKPVLSSSRFFALS